MSEGNTKLIELGANALSSGIFEDTIDTLCNGNLGIKKLNKPSLSLFDDVGQQKSSSEEIESNELEMSSQVSFFEFFMSKLYQEYPKNSIFKPKELEEKFSIKLSQVNAWIAEAEEKKLIKRLDGRVKKYQSSLISMMQGAMLGGAAFHVIS